MKIALVDEDGPNSRSGTSRSSNLPNRWRHRGWAGRRPGPVRRGKIWPRFCAQPGFGEGFGPSSRDDRSWRSLPRPGRMEGPYLQGLLAKSQFEVLADVGRPRLDARPDQHLAPAGFGRACESSRPVAGFLRFADTLLKDLKTRPQTGIEGGLLISHRSTSSDRPTPASPFPGYVSQAMIWQSRLARHVRPYPSSKNAPTGHSPA